MKDTIIFGAGRKAQGFLIEYYNRIHIKYVMDNYKEGTFLGYEIKKPFYDRNNFIIVAVEGDGSYELIRKELIELGYVEFTDFIPYTIYNKKMALAYGNCHMRAVKRYMELSCKFDSQYGFYPLHEIQNLKKFPSDDIIRHADLILHQSIQENNKYGKQYASERLLEKASENSIILSLPNLYGLPKALFPQLVKEEKQKKLQNSFMIGTEINVARWICEGKKIEDMAYYIQCGGVYSDSEIKMYWKEFINKLLDREKQWDVKISDYILNYYKTQKLFSDTWHISTVMARVIAERTLLKMGICERIEETIPCLDDYEVFLYEDVKRALGITWNEHFIRQYTRFHPKKCHLNLIEYIKVCIQEITYEMA